MKIFLHGTKQVVDYLARLYPYQKTTLSESSGNSVSWECDVNAHYTF